MADDNKTLAIVETLRALLALAALTILVLVYLNYEPQDTNRVGLLLLEAIPSAVVLLLAVALAYYLFRRHQTELTGALHTLDTHELARKLAEHLTPLEAVPPGVMSWASFLAALEALRSKILEDPDFKPDVVVSIGRSGALAGSLLAGNLGGLEHYGLDRIHTFSSEGVRSTVITPDCEALRSRIEGKRLLVVMAECITGGTLQRGRDELAEWVGAGVLKTAAVLRSESAGFRPDYIGDKHDGRHLVFRSSRWKRHSIAKIP